jgi:hypothetical protein
MASKADLVYKKADSAYQEKLKKLYELSATKYVYASELVENSKTLILGKDTLELAYPEECHTNGDLVVFIKSNKRFTIRLNEMPNFILLNSNKNFNFVASNL